MNSTRKPMTRNPIDAIATPAQTDTDGFTILVIEDEDLLRSSMERGLSVLPSVRALGAGNVQEANKKIHSLRPQLIISDLDLPDGSGLDILQTLDKAALHIPVIFVSGYIQKYIREIPISSNIEIYEKPFTLNALRAVVETYLTPEESAQALPFQLTDYIQLACVGTYSLNFYIDRKGHEEGHVTIYKGQLWAAQDSLGTGPEALRRLLFEDNTLNRCEAIQEPEVLREFEGSWQTILLESARVYDEANKHTGRKVLETISSDGWNALDSVLNSADDWSAVTPDAVDTAPLPPDVPAPIPPTSPHDLPSDPEEEEFEYQKAARRLKAYETQHGLQPYKAPQHESSVFAAPSNKFDSNPSYPAVSASYTNSTNPFETQSTEKYAPASIVQDEFGRLVDEGVDALLVKDYTAAYKVFCAAHELDPTDSRVNANLRRLRELGHGDDTEAT